MLCAIHSLTERVIGVAKILVVDDQLGVRRLLYEMFREDQHEVEMASNGSEAIQLLHSFQPELILMDMKMPGLNGLEVLHRIRAIDQHVGVIMMTAYGDIREFQQGEELAVLDYISKPFDLFELRQKVESILKYPKEP